MEKGKLYIHEQVSIPSPASIFPLATIQLPVFMPLPTFISPQLLSFQRLLTLHLLLPCSQPLALR
jgi:hypothetical protein